MWEVVVGLVVGLVRVVGLLETCFFLRLLSLREMLDFVSCGFRCRKSSESEMAGFVYS